MSLILDGTSGLFGNVTGGDISGNFIIDSVNLQDGSVTESKIAPILATGTTAPRNLQDRFADVVNVKDFGAVGDGVTDDTAAIQNAINSIDNNLGGTVFFPKGAYRTTNTITTNGESIILQGVGRNTTQIIADHNLGPVIQIGRQYSGIKCMGILASSERISVLARRNMGILFERLQDLPDSGSYRMRQCFVEDVLVQDQPSHGIVFVGPITDGSTILRSRVRANGGHGIVVDRGYITDRVNLSGAGSGLMNITNCSTQENGGHGLLLGHPNDPITTPSLRCVVENLESGSNATDPTVRFEAYQAWIRGTNHEIRASVFTGGNDGIGGIWIAGRNHWIRNNRFISRSTSINVGNFIELPTEGINIEGLTVLNVAQNPAISVDSGAKNIRVLNWLPSNIVTLITPNIPGTQIDSIEQYIKKTTDQVVTNSITLVDDTHLKFPVNESNSYYFAANIEFTAGTTSEIKLAFTVPIGATLRWGPINGLKVDPTGSVVVQGQETSSGNAISFGSAPGGARQLITVTGYVECGAGENGNLQLQWAQNTASSLEPTTVRNGSSYLKVFTYKN